MDKNIEFYLYHGKGVIPNNTISDILNELDTVDNWKHFPKDERNLKGTFDKDAKKMDGLAGSSLTVDWNDIYNKEMNIDSSVELNYSLCRLPQSPALDEFNTAVSTTLDYYIKDYLKDINWYDCYNGKTDPQFINYKTEHDMITHCDHVRHIFDGERKGIPTLSIVGMLTDNYDGGEIVFWEDKSFKLGKGDLLIFPSNFLYPHEIKEVVSGNRISFVSWVW